MKEPINDQVIIYPTDTVWGLGGSVFSQKAYDEIALIKKTNHTKPLSIMFSSIEMICEYFTLPDFMNEQWLKEFFSLETTLGLPLSFLKKEFPAWLTAKSPMVSIRFVDSDLIKKVGESFKTPFFTTSLNLTKEAPIINFKAALEFRNMHAPGLLIFGDESHQLSGESSTIVFYDPDKKINFQIIRSGRNILEIQKLINS